MEKKEIKERLDIHCPIKWHIVDSKKQIWNKEKRQYEVIECKSRSIMRTQLEGRKALVELLYEYLNK